MGRRVVTHNEVNILWRRGSLRRLFLKEIEKFAFIRGSVIEVLSTFKLLKKITYM
jgi:hypothetical protein